MKTSRSLTTKRPPSLKARTPDRALELRSSALRACTVLQSGTGRIAESAYRRAAAQDFAGEHELDDWLAAEREIDAQTATPGAKPRCNDCRC
jgi:hypothetical protein